MASPAPPPSTQSAPAAPALSPPLAPEAPPLAAAKDEVEAAEARAPEKKKTSPSKSSPSKNSTSKSSSEAALKVKLRKACEEGLLESMRENIDKLLRGGGNVDEPLDEGDPALLVVARSAKGKYVDCLEALIVEYECDLMKENSAHETALFVAAKASHVKVIIEIERLCKKVNRPDIFVLLLNHKQSDGFTPVMVAARGQGKNDTLSPCLARLLSYPDVDLWAVDDTKQNVLFHAVLGDETETDHRGCKNEVAVAAICQKLAATHVAHGHKPSDHFSGLRLLGAVDSEGQTVLIVAAVHGRKACIKALLKFAHWVPPTPKGVKFIDMFDEEGTAAFHCCNNSDPLKKEDKGLLKGYPDCLQLLVEKFADVNLRPSPNSMYPLVAAASHGHRECVEILLRHGANSIEAASKASNFELSTLIKEHNTKLEGDLAHALSLAASGGDVKFMKFFWEKLVKTTAPERRLEIINVENDRTNAFLLACRYGRTEMVKFLKDKCDIKVTCKGTFRTAPIFACLGGHHGVLEELIKTDAYHPAGTDVDDEIPLHVACMGAFDDCIELILDDHLTYVAVETQVEGKQRTAPAPLLMRTSPHGDPHKRTALQWYLRRAGDFASESIVIEFIENDLPCTKDGSFRNHSHSWAALLDLRSGLSEDKCLALVEALFNAPELKPRDKDGNQPRRGFPCAKILRELATAKDESNRSCLLCTFPKVKNFIQQHLYFCGQFDLSPGLPIHMSSTTVVIAADDHNADRYYVEAFNDAFNEFKDCASNPVDSALASAEPVLNHTKFQKALKWLIDKHIGNSVGSNDITKMHFDQLSNGGVVTRDLFVKYCLEYVGETVKVAIKFMHSHDQWKKELDMRGYEYDPNTGLLNPRKKESDPKKSDPTKSTSAEEDYITDLLPHGLSLERIRDATANTQYVAGYKQEKGGKVEQLETLGEMSSAGPGYTYAIVMPFADRSLDEIFRKERPHIQQIQTIMKEVGEALKQCHLQNIMHGDLKMLNVIRLHGRIKLIDMDASCVFSDPELKAQAGAKSDPELKAYAGAKFSSGVLPPEMFYELKGDERKAYENYWSQEGRDIVNATVTHKIEHWAKVAPRKAKSGTEVKWIVVKTFRHIHVAKSIDGHKDDKDDKGGLPYDLVEASPALDIWAFGCMLYQLLCGEPLLPVNLSDDLARPKDMLQALTWTNEQLDAKINAIPIYSFGSDEAKDLLRRILRVDATNRLEIAEVLQHSFFKIQISTYEDTDSSKLALHRWLDGDTRGVKDIKALIVDDAAKEKDDGGMLPLHWASANHASLDQASLEVIQELLKAYPEGVKEKDEDGMLPLHWALANQAPTEVIQELLKAYPKGVKEKDKEGRLPIHWAAERKAPADVIFELLLLDLPFNPDSSDGNKSQSHSQSWTSAIELLKSDPEKQKEVVKMLFEKYPGHCKDLAFCKNPAGREAIYLAHSDVQQVMYKYIYFCGRYEIYDEHPIHISATAVVVAALDRQGIVDYANAFENASVHHRTNGGLTREGVKVAITVALPGTGGAHDEKVDERFQSYVEDQHAPSMPKEEFLQFVTQLSGKDRRVAIKFMSNEQQWQREVDVRTKRSLKKDLIIALFEDAPGPKLIKKQAGKLGSFSLKANDGSSFSLAGYNHWLVFPFADHTLKDIGEKEQPDLKHVEILMSELGRALEHCHVQKLVHGDVKMANALRLEEHIHFIDMDASCIFSPSNESKCEYVGGGKFNSGILPPEMFYELKDAKEKNRWREYWSKRLDIDGADKEKWSKIQPREVTLVDGKVKTTRSVVVKTFAKIGDDVPDLDGLPEKYKQSLVRAHPTLDIWSFGCVLFSLVSGGSLFDVDGDDNLKTAEAVVAMVDSEKLERFIKARIDKLRPVGNGVSSVKDLLHKLLRVNPKDRFQSMAEVLQHPFLLVKEGNARKSQRQTLSLDGMITHVHEKHHEEEAEADGYDYIVDEVYHVGEEVIGRLSKRIDSSVEARNKDLLTKLTTLANLAETVATNAKKSSRGGSGTGNGSKSDDAWSSSEYDDSRRKNNSQNQTKEIAHKHTKHHDEEEPDTDGFDYVVEDIYHVGEEVIKRLGSKIEDTGLPRNKDLLAKLNTIKNCLDAAAIATAASGSSWCGGGGGNTGALSPSNADVVSGANPMHGRNPSRGASAAKR